MTTAEQQEELQRPQLATTASDFFSKGTARGKPNQTRNDDATKIVAEYMRPFSNVTTASFFDPWFPSGFRNQMMSFSSFVMESKKRNMSQILVESLQYKILHNDWGRKEKYPSLMDMVFIQFDELFDTKHWNSFYPEIPRIVSCDPIIHSERGCERPFFPSIRNFDAATKPYVFGRYNHLLTLYMRYTKGKGPLTVPEYPNPVDLILKRGAIRPHPRLQRLVDDFLESMGGKSYMTLHARVEPDMQRHYVCRDKKERRLMNIFRSVEASFPDPPAPIMFLPINRWLLEREVNLTLARAAATNITKSSTENGDDGINWIAIENLKELNRAIRDGLWGGRVKVFELGSEKLTNTSYESSKLLVGALLDYFVALQAPSIFIGTEVSSFSHDIMTTRYFRGNLENYKYLPGEVIKKWTTNENNRLEPFYC